MNPKKSSAQTDSAFFRLGYSKGERVLVVEVHLVSFSSALIMLMSLIGCAVWLQHVGAWGSIGKWLLR